MAVTLPAQPGAMIGRAVELDALRTLLVNAGARLVTITGTAGAGKTRLAVAAAAEVESVFEDGAAFVDLSPIREPDLVLLAIARALRVRETSGQPLLRTLEAHLHERHLLLVLDNCEQVLPAARNIAVLLEASTRLAVLATSREPLRLRWEQRLPLAPLRVPEPRQPATPQALMAVPACALFVTRARAVRPDFRLTAANAGAVAQICRRLDGLPLAIELAAARSGLLSPTALLERLEHRLDLRSSDQDRPPRQRALREAIAWSYELLRPEEQVLFSRLAVFAGGFSLASARAVCASPDMETSLDDVLGAFVERGLLQVPEADGEELHFRMLETIHEFAFEQLETSGQLAAVQRNHADFFLHLAERAERASNGPEQVEWLTYLDRSHDNLRAALRYALDRNDGETALRLGAALAWFWLSRGHWTEGRHWLERALECDAPGSPAGRARALRAAGELARRQGAFDAAEKLLQEGLQVCRALPDNVELARTLNNLGNVAATMGHYPRAQTMYEESLSLLRQQGDGHLISMALGNLANVLRYQGQIDAARALYEEALGLAREMGDAANVAMHLKNLGALLLVRGADELAEAHLQQSLQLRQELHDKAGVASVLRELAILRHRHGEWAQALALCRQALRLQHETAAAPDMPRCLDVLAATLTASGRAEQGAQVWGAAEALEEATGAVSEVHLDYASELAAARINLGAQAFAAAWARGRALQLDQILVVALADPPDSAPGSPEALTAREREVALLMAQGYSNRRIADALVIGERTVETHVGNVLGKLGLASRFLVGAWLAEHGLI